MKLSEIKSAVMAGKTVSNAPNNTGEQLMTHPLTDESLQQIGCSNPRARVFDTQAMRTAYDLGRDDQLEQVIDWLRNNLNENYIWVEVIAPGLDAESVIVDLKQAMRPTQEDS